MLAFGGAKSRQPIKTTRARGPFLLLPRPLPERRRGGITCYLNYPLPSLPPPPLAPLSEHAVSNVDKYHQLNIEITPGARTLLARISAQQLVIAAAEMGVLLSPVHISHPQDTDNAYFLAKTDL